MPAEVNGNFLQERTETVGWKLDSNSGERKHSLLQKPRENVIKVNENIKTKEIILKAREKTKTLENIRSFRLVEKQNQILKN